MDFARAGAVNIVVDRRSLSLFFSPLVAPISDQNAEASHIFLISVVFTVAAAAESKKRSRKKHIKCDFKQRRPPASIVTIPRSYQTKPSDTSTAVYLHQHRL